MFSTAELIRYILPLPAAAALVWILQIICDRCERVWAENLQEKGESPEFYGDPLQDVSENGRRVEEESQVIIWGIRPTSHLQPQRTQELIFAHRLRPSVIKNYPSPLNIYDNAASDTAVNIHPFLTCSDGLTHTRQEDASVLSLLLTHSILWPLCVCD